MIKFHSLCAILFILININCISEAQETRKFLYETEASIAAKAWFSKLDGFGELREAEINLINYSQGGYISDYWFSRTKSTDIQEKNSETAVNYKKWKNQENRSIRRDVIEWLVKYKAKNGGGVIGLSGYIIEGSINLANISAPAIYICFSNCAFTGEISLARSQLLSLSLSNCYIHGIEAESLNVIRDVSFAGSTADSQFTLDNMSVGGFLVCSGLNIKSQGTQQAINAVNINISAGCILSDMKCVGTLCLQNATINGNLSLDNSSLSVGIPQTNASEQTSDSGSFGEERTYDDANAIEAEHLIVRGDCFVRGCTTTGDLDLANANIGGNLRFNNTTFTQLNQIDLSNSTVSGDCNFSGIDSHAEINMRNVQILNNIIIGPDYSTNRNATISVTKANKADDYPAIVTCGSHINGDLTLNATVNGSVDICTCEIGRNLDITNLKWTDSPSAFLSMFNTKIGTLTLAADNWPPFFDINDCTYNTLIVLKKDGSSSCDKSDFMKLVKRNPDAKNFSFQPYEQLAKTLRNVGDDGNAIEILILKNRDFNNYLKYTHTRTTYQWFWYGLFGKWIGYGYRPWLVFIYSCIAISMTSVICIIGNKMKLFKDNKNYREDHKQFNSVVYSFETFTPIIQLGHSECWSPNMTSKLGFWLQMWIWLHMIIGFVLTTLWFGGITGLIKS